MIILGMHGFFIIAFEHFWRLINYTESGYHRYLEALIIFLLFIPINKWVMKYLPILNGMYRK